MAEKERADVSRIECVGGPYDTPGSKKKRPTMTFFGTYGNKPELPAVVPIHSHHGLYRLVGGKYHWEEVGN